MSETNFVTHMSKAFTDKYGELFTSFFIHESLYGRYLSSADLYLYLHSDPTLPEQSNFTRYISNIIDLEHKLIESISFDKVQLGSFFKETKLDIKEARDSEKTYLEILFACVCYEIHCGKRDFNASQIQNLDLCQYLGHKKLNAFLPSYIRENVFQADKASSSTC